MGKKQIYISDEDLKEILPGYLLKKRSEITLIQELFNKKDYLAIRSIAHNIKGTALSYGIQGAGEIAALLETALIEDDINSALVHFKSLKDVFDNLEVIYT